MVILALLVISGTAELTLVAISKIADLELLAFFGIFVEFVFSCRNKKQCMGERGLLKLTSKCKCLRKSCTIKYKYLFMQIFLLWP